jgi:Rrf2 family protein
MKLSRESRYALEALVVMAEIPDGEMWEARDIAHAADLPAAFLAKILQTLARDGILESMRGHGYRMARPPDQTTVEEVLTALEGPEYFGDRCIFWRQECNDENPCVLHWRYRDLRPGLESIIGRITISQLRERGPLPHTALLDSPPRSLAGPVSDP